MGQGLKPNLFSILYGPTKPQFPVRGCWKGPRVRFSRKENRMKCHGSLGLYRKLREVCPDTKPKLCRSRATYPTQAKGRLEWGTQRWLPVWEKIWGAHGTCSTDRPVLAQTLQLSSVVAQCGTAARLAEKSRFLKGRACSPYRSFLEIPESLVASGSARLSEKRMHFVREKRDKPPGRRFHAGKRLSDKRDKPPDGGRHRGRWPKISALKAL